MLNQSKSCAATPAIVVTTHPEEPAPRSRDGMGTLFGARVLEEKPPRGVSAVVLAATAGGGCCESLEQQPQGSSSFLSK